MSQIEATTDQQCVFMAFDGFCVTNKMYDFVQTAAVVCQIAIVNLRSFRCHLNQTLANTDDSDIN